MIQTITQILALLAGAVFVRALLLRLGVQLRFEHALAVGILIFLAILSSWFFRDRWNFLDDQRHRYAGLSPQMAAGTCTAVGVDGQFLAFVGREIPVRERFYMETGGRLAGGGDLCVRFSLLPRLQVGYPEQARYLVFWEAESREKFDAAIAQGGTVLRKDRTHFVVRKP